MFETAVTLLLWLAAAFLGVLVLAFMVGVIQAIARRRHPGIREAGFDDDPDDEDDDHRAEALAIGRYILAHGLDQGEVWVRVRRCEAHGGKHLDIGLLPSLEDLS